MHFCRFHIYIYIPSLYIYDFHVQRKNKEVSQFTTSSFTGEITDLYPSEDKERGHGADAASWANCSSKSSTSTVPNCLIMFDIFFADLDMRIFWHVSDCLSYFDPSHPGVQCRVPKFHLGHVAAIPWRTASATPCEVPPRALVFWRVKAPGRAEAVNGEGTSPYVRHFCRYHVHWNNL